MPTFKTTENIVTGAGEYFDPNWMDSNHSTSLISSKAPEKSYQELLPIENHRQTPKEFGKNEQSP